MKKIKWVDCPICGSSGSMEYKKDVCHSFKPPRYTTIEIKGLDGHFCRICHDGFYSSKSERKITRELTENMAEQDSERVVAAEMMSVQEAAQAMKMTPQGVHKMMRDGRMRYVKAAGLRFPLRKEVKEKAAALSQEMMKRRQSRGKFVF